jgi:hypothetical protein
MILERMTVSGFRKLAAPFTFIPNEHFTVIHAPNGTGKTTLLDALYHGLLERHTVTGEKARERFESVGRELVPRIDIDFAVNDVRYRLRKSFLTARSASLQRWESGRYVPLKEGAAADDFVRELFRAEPPGKGPIEPTKHLGFAHVLWSPARASFDNVPDAASDQIRAMLGVEVSAVTDGERDVQERVFAEYARFYTGGGGWAAGAAAVNVPALQRRVAEAQIAVTYARDQYDLLESLTRDYQDRSADVQLMEAKRAALRVELATAKANAAIFAELERKAERSATAEQTAREAYDRVSEAVGSIATSRKELDQAMNLRARAATEIQELQSNSTIVNARVTGAQKAAEDATAQVGSVQKRAVSVTLAQSYVDARSESLTIAATIAAHERDASKLQQHRTAHAEILTPSREDLEHLREQATDLARLEATIAASALAIEIDAEVDVTIDVIAGEHTGPLMLKAGGSASIAATEEVVAIDVPGLGRIRARGADGAAKARKKAQPIAAFLGNAWERYGTSSLPELARRTERANELARQIAELERVCAERLADRRIDEFQAALAGADARIGAIERANAGWREDSPNVVILRAASDRELAASGDVARAASAQLAAELRAKGALDEAFTEAKDRLNATEMALQAIAVRLSTFESDGFDDVAREQRLQHCAFELYAAQGTRTEVDAKIAAFAENPTELVDRLELGEREAGTAFESAYGQAKMYLAQLDMQTKRGTYSKLGECEEALDHVKGELARTLAQAEAIKCLRDAFDGIRSSRLEAVLAPITSAATRYMNRIAGSPMGRISIGDGFAPLGLIEQASQMFIGIKSTLSSGEKEQIYLSTRLALAEVIADGLGRQLFVVDDAITSTDPNRLRRFIAILEELSRKRLQVIVTTADKSRYLGIAGAKHVDLAAELFLESAA